MSRWMLVLLAVLGGCALAQAPRIPMKIAPEEYEVYTAWLKQHPHAKPHQTYYLAMRTFPFSAFISSPDDYKALKDAGVDEAVLKQHSDLGEAEFRVDLRSLMEQFPGVFKADDLMVQDQPRTWELISFSRVAFDSKGTQALFAVISRCGSTCGSGSVLLARREGRTWAFKDTGYLWNY